jgi:hypothetical protein
LAPGTTADLQLAPPSVVTANVPLSAPAHTTRAFTGLTAKKRCLVPLFWGVSAGVNPDGQDSPLVPLAEGRPPEQATISAVLITPISRTLVPHLSGPRISRGDFFSTLP